MPWTAPRTWTDTEVVTASMMNAQLRDNLEVLETVRDASGRVSSLTSSTLANLSAANLSGLADPSAANSLTAGRQRFNGSARFVVPVGADKWTGTKGVDAAGVWVEGDHFHHIADDSTTEWRYLGTYVSTPLGARSGSVWVEGDCLHYIDADGDERKMESKSVIGHTDTSAEGGSAWTETYVHWIRESGSTEKPGHADVTHSDHDDHHDYTDHDDNGPHSDYSDHDDVTHVMHSDYSDHEDHDDLVGSEWEHDDHGDHLDHTDYTDHDDHDDSGPHDDHDDHDDTTPHSDVTPDNRPVTA